MLHPLLLVCFLTRLKWIHFLNVHLSELRTGTGMIYVIMLTLYESRNHGKFQMDVRLDASVSKSNVRLHIFKNCVKCRCCSRLQSTLRSETMF